MASTRAVKETQGQVLSYRGKVFPSFFHSTCGGHTANIADLWDMQEHPSLRGVECDFCKLSRHYRWSSEISRFDLEKKLKGAGYSVFGLQSFEVGIKDRGKRAKTIIVRDSKGKKTIVASDFRFIAGPDKIKSSLIEKIENRGDKFRIRGKGWGHGAGLCQYGARHLGELGYVAKQILRFYYPDSETTQFWPQNQFL
ncbi:MAG: SpoIID/LytB domain-containing protein [Candidatus Omnitrophica bacterium]|nr:SpoIID/LytB domain-containing protein [Candidatus Omnitrophota bacterium]